MLTKDHIEHVKSALHTCEDPKCGKCQNARVCLELAAAYERVAALLEQLKTLKPENGGVDLAWLLAAFDRALEG